MSEPTKAGIEFYGGYQVYSESGVDLTLLRENLKRPITERLENNSRMLPFLAELSAAAAGGGIGDNRFSPRSDMLNVEPILRCLEAGRVDYVLIGGLAMRAHGSAHITEDLDVCYARTASNIAALAAGFASLHPYLRGAPAGLPFHFDGPTIQAGLNFTLITDCGPVDLLGEVSGVGSYPQARVQSEEKILFGMAVRVLSLDGLIAAKRAAGRVKDRNHLLELEELKKMRDAAP